VVLLQPSVYDVRFPDAYLVFLDSFRWLNFTFPFKSLECVFRTNYHDRLTTAVVLSSAIMAALVCGLVRSAKNDSRLLSLCIVPSYLLYPSTSSAFFQVFNCRDIDTASRLTLDLSIDCSSDEHKRAETLAASFILLFSIGLPVMYQVLLHPHRHRLASSISHEDDAAGGAPVSSFKALSFLYQDYKTE
jgi:hypothetical protein